MSTAPDDDLSPEDVAKQIAAAQAIGRSIGEICRGHEVSIVANALFNEWIFCMCLMNDTKEEARAEIQRCADMAKGEAVYHFWDYCQAVKRKQHN